MSKKLFQLGNKAACVNRGKRKETGRTMALLSLDQVLRKACNRKHLEEALERLLRRDPASFFKQIIVPLIPRSALDRLEADAESERALQQRQELFHEASLLLCRELEATGNRALCEPLCRSLSRLLDESEVTEVVLSIGDDPVPTRTK